MRSRYWPPRECALDSAGRAYELAAEASPRFVACVVDSFDEAGVPDDLTMPRWGWDGPAS